MPAAGAAKRKKGVRVKARDYGALLREILPREKGRPGAPKLVQKPEEAAYRLARAGVEPNRVRALLGDLNGSRAAVDAEIDRGAELYRAQLEASLCRVAVTAKGSATTKALVGRNRLAWAVNLPQMESAKDLEQVFSAGLDEAQTALVKTVDHLLKTRRDADDD